MKTENYPSDRYRMMIYFAAHTIFIYSKDLICSVTMTVAEFGEQNKEIIQRVFDEGLSIMNYELSTEQMNRAIYSFMQAKYYPLSVKETEVYNLQPKQ